MIAGGEEERLIDLLASPQVKMWTATIIREISRLSAVKIERCDPLFALSPINTVFGASEKTPVHVKCEG